MKKNKLFLFSIIGLSLFAITCCTSNSGDEGGGGSDDHPSRVTTKFLNYDDTVLYANTIPYGGNAVYEGEKPKRQSSNTTVYSFSGWDKSLENIIVDTTFHAQYSETARKYNISFINYDDEVLETQNLEYDSMPIYGGRTPTRPSSDQYSYTFSNWSPEITKVSSDAVYKAEYLSTTNKYTVTWVVDGAVTTEEYEYGAIPAFKGSTEKARTAEYSYTFSGWEPNIKSVSSDVTYTAQYSSSRNFYTITWLDWDGSVIKTGSYEYGSELTINDPVRRGDAQYSYTFSGWEPKMTTVTSNATYIAQYTENVNTYTVVWMVDGNKTEEIYEYGEIPTFKGSTEKARTAEYSYTFTGWKPQIETVSKNVTYTAQYSSSKNSYNITWKNWDGSVLDTDSVEYGKLPSYDGSTPKKDSEELYYYAFVGWSPTLKNVTGDAEYTAVFQKNNIYDYDFTSDNSECYITKYNANLEEISIPSSIDGVPVTTIKKNAFSNSATLKKVTIPNSVTSIETAAFSNCTALSDISLPSGLLTIGSSAFSACSSLKTIVIPDTVTTIGYAAFNNCSKLDTITVPFVGESKSSRQYLSHIFGGNSYSDSGLVVPSLKTIVLSQACENIYSNAFYNCSEIKKILIRSNNIKFQSCFAGCTSLSIVEIEECVTTIIAGAFNGCSMDGNYVLHGGLSSIGQNAFANCFNANVNFYGTLEEWLSISGKVGMPSTLHLYLDDDSETKSISFPDGTTSISDYALNGANITTVIIPEGVTSIGDYAFANCLNLSSITLPNSLVSIGERAFSGCASLESVSFGSNLESIGDYCFSGCSSIKNIVVPKNVTYIGAYSFGKCNSLESLTIPFIGKSKDTKSGFGSIFEAPSYGGDYIVPSSLKEVTITGGSIWTDSFLNCSGYFKLYLTDEFETIERNGFEYCDCVSSVDVGGNITELGEHAFYMSDIAKVSIGEGITTIGFEAFRYCEKLKEINIPSTVNTIGAFAFSGTGIESISLPSALTVIDRGVFSNCESLKTISIPEGITTIKQSAFSSCTSLEEVIMPSTITNLEDYVFNNCSNSLVVKFKINSFTEYLSIDGLNNLSGINEIRFIDANNETITDFVIPSNVVSIPSRAFNNCSSMNTVTISEGVTTISDNAFLGCTNLKTVYIPSSVNSIGAAFTSCSSLTDIYITVNSVADFINVTGKQNLVGSVHLMDNNGNEITEIVVPDTITSLPKYAFANCNNICSMSIPASVTNIDYGILSGCTSIKTLTIPYITSIGTIFSTGNAYVPSCLETIIISDGCQSIKSSAFEKCTAFEEVIISGTVETIGSSAFAYCTGLTTVTIAEGTTKLESGCFHSCSNLTSVYLPSTLSSIGMRSFAWCTSLTSIYFNGTIEQWNSITLESEWNRDSPISVVHCLNGDIVL